MASSIFAPGRGDDIEPALAKARFGDDGGRIAGGMAEWTAYEQAPPAASFVQESDLQILRLLRQIAANGLTPGHSLRGVILPANLRWHPGGSGSSRISSRRCRPCCGRLFVRRGWRVACWQRHLTEVDRHAAGRFRGVPKIAANF